MRPASALAAVSLLCTLCMAAPVRAQSSLTPALEPVDWSRLQGRVTFSAPLRTEPLNADAASRASSISLIGDYYLRPSLNQLSVTGLRATSGVMFGQRSPLWGLPPASVSAYAAERRASGFDSHLGNGADHATTPYLGIGYTGGGTSRASSWGFSADLGLMSLAPGNIRGLGKVFNGSQNLDDMVRDLRLAPVLQLGFSYAF